MAPQFVEFNGDSHIDIVTATFDGSPHVSFGTPQGFAQPKQMLDAKDQRIQLRQFWNYESKQWENQTAQPEGHCTSAVVFDWDADGDLDLLIGSYDDGQLYLQLNEGKPGAPKFTGVNVPVLAAGDPIRVAGGITTPQLIDFNDDGLMDLVLGGYGDSHGRGPGGGVWLYLNTGSRGAPNFARPLTLIPPSDKDAQSATRPDSGLYPHVVDYDGDGDLDLVVGGYSHWTPPRRQLTTQEQARADELTRLIDTAHNKLFDLRRDAFEDLEDATPEEHKAAYEKLNATPEYQQLNEAFKTHTNELETLIPSLKREPFVWLYERTTVGPPSTPEDTNAEGRQSL